MELRESLTKENFWNAIMEQFPKSTKLFCDWIDQYKESVGWDALFNANYFDLHALDVKGNLKENGKIASIFPTRTLKATVSPKFHDLPYDMQAGIWIRFVNDTLSDYFEQPEYQYSFDLEEDIKIVFGEIEKELDDNKPTPNPNLK